MTLKDRNWLPHYDSKISNIATEFFVPALAESTLYRRIAGHFSSTSFALCARGIKELISNSGKMQLIVSPILTSVDLQAMKDTTNYDKIISDSLIIQLENVESEFEKNHIDALKFLLKEKLLEIRIDLPRDSNNKLVDMDSVVGLNLLSEKRGILQDRDGNAMSFRGPINESRENWEKGTFEITVDVSWIDGQVEHVKEDIRIFNSKWNSSEIIHLPGLVQNYMVRTAPESKDKIDIEKFNIPPWAVLSNGGVLWPHQIKAVNAWVENGHRGVMSMATGSGKTLTSLVAGNLAPKHMLILIVAYGKVLIRQWKNEVLKFDRMADVILCDSDTNWKELLAGKLAAYYRDNLNLSSKRLYIIATPQTAILESFQRKFDYVDSDNIVLIADEVHHLGAESFSKVFDINASQRLGLSATYRRDWDEPGTQNILNYFGRALEEAKYGLGEAIRDGRLCKYNYFPFFAFLNGEEFDEYVELSVKIKREFARIKLKENSKNLPVIPKMLEFMLHKRAEILKKTQDKRRAYQEIIANRPKTPYVIFADDKEQANEILQAHREKVHEMNRESADIQTDDLMLFSGDSDQWQRERIISEVKRKGTPLLSMYCLDEGVDLPELKSAIIVASSTSKRQYIQRRGRILRLAEKRKIAELYDIIVLGPNDYDPTRREVSEGIIKKERERMSELSHDAENRWEVILKLDRQMQRMGFGYVL